MKRYLVLIPTLVLSFVSFAQNAQLEIKGTITDDSTGIGLSECIISIKEFNGNLIETVTSTSLGKYKLSKVQSGKNYKVFFSKENYISKYCVVETDKIDPNDSTDLSLEISSSLFKGDIADYSFLQFAPVAIASYDKTFSNLMWDMDYIVKMKELMDKIKNKK